MKLAADRDAVARQYANGFDDVIKVIAPALVKRYADGESLDHAIVWAHMDQMAREPDSLIRRKCGNDLAAESSRRARAVIDADWPNTLESVELYRELDEWLREDGHRRNPGTSADLVTAGLFVALRDGAIEWPALWSGSLQLAGE
jgi:triphosphoribosyl-dephospho-CoA synthase